MLTIGLIGLLFVVVSVAGLQFTYLFYLDRLDRERKKHIREVELRASSLAAQLDSAERRLAEQAALIERFVPELILEDEAWADLIDER